MSDNGKRQRSAIEILIILLTVIVAFYIVAGTIGVIVIELNDPLTDTSRIADSLYTMITAILGALLGLLAGRSEK